MSRQEKMKGNTNGKGNKGRKFKPETIEKMRLAKLGKPSNARGSKRTLECRERISKSKLASFQKDNLHYISFSCDDRKKIRRERIKIFGGLHSQGEWETLKAQYNWTCPCCKKSEPEIKLTRDHIIPISKGGSDNIENIQPLCIRCNVKKATKSIRY